MRKLILIGVMLPLLAIAEVTPPKGSYDSRVRVLDYNPNDVVKLATFYGVSTHVQFGDAETIKDVAVGDDLAWKVIPRGNHLFIKPVAANANTNVTIVTDRHTYHFALVVQPRPIKDATAWADPNLIFSLGFRYPKEEAAKAATMANAALIGGRLEESSQRDVAAASGAAQHLDYWVAGASEISPTAARDDGRFIYLTFSGNRDMPAVYSVDEQGNEALVNTHVMDGNTIVVHRMVRRLMLRKGDAVASVLNQSFDLDGGRDNSTGTVAPNVERLIKGLK